MNENSSESDDGVSRRKVVELVVGYSAYVMAGGSIAALDAVDADASVAAEPSIGLIKDLFNRLDSNMLLQGIAVSQLSFIETDYFDYARDRPSDLWECMETWPTEARQEAVEQLLSIAHSLDC